MIMCCFIWTHFIGKICFFKDSMNSIYFAGLCLCEQSWSLQGKALRVFHSISKHEEKKHYRKHAQAGSNNCACTWKYTYVWVCACRLLEGVQASLFPRTCSGKTCSPCWNELRGSEPVENRYMHANNEF